MFQRTAGLKSTFYARPQKNAIGKLWRDIHRGLLNSLDSLFSTRVKLGIMSQQATQETQQVRLRKVPRDVMRLAKSKAALLGETLENYLTALIVKAVKK